MKKLILLFFTMIGVLLIGAGCSTLESIAFGTASNGTVLKAETTGSTTSGTLAPNIFAGTVQNSIASAPALKEGEKTQIVVAYTESQSFWASILGLSAITRTFTYIGNPSESAAETSARMDGFAKVLTSNSKPKDTEAAKTGGQ